MNQRILFIATKDIKMLDVPLVLDAMGYKSIYKEVPFGVKEYGEQHCSIIEELINADKPDIVWTCDFSRAVAEVCNRRNLPYISWIYDCPQEELYSEQVKYDNNYIFVFDKQQLIRIRELGVKNVYHMPLAIYPDRIRVALSQIQREREYRHDVTLIGSLYYMESNEKILSLLNKPGQDEWERIVNCSLLTWDDNVHMYGTMSEPICNIFRQIDQGAYKEASPYMDEQFWYETAVLSRHLAHRERIKILNVLSEDYQVDLYTKDKMLEGLSSQIHIHPGMDYSEYTIFQIYNRSKININITLHCIESGLSQRLFDVMGAGGFMLTNYQPEIEEYFVLGEDLAVYHNLDEMRQMVDYYIQHDDERKRIAANGQRKVLAEHSYEDRFKKIMQFIERV